MRSLPIAFCELCAEQLGAGRPITVRTAATIDHPDAACCPHVLAEYLRLDARQSDMFRPGPAEWARADYYDSDDDLPY